MDDPVGEGLAYLRRRHLGAYQAIGPIVFNALDGLYRECGRRREAPNVTALRRRLAFIVAREGFPMPKAGGR
ncbi:MAG: hypothetical protein AB7Q29_11655 [Vicinamibacterales bacterium]